MNLARLFAALVSLLLLAGCPTPPDPMNDPLIARIYLEARPGEAATVAQLPISKININISPKPVFMETDITDAKLVRLNQLGWCMELQFTHAAAIDLNRLTSANVGRRLVLTFNDMPAGARRIDAAMPDGTFLVFVEVDDVNLPPLVERLKRTSAKIAKHAH